MEHNFFRPDQTNIFLKFEMTGEELQAAMSSVTDSFLAVLQNKISTYAEAHVDNMVEFHPDPAQQMAAILESRRLQHFVMAYKELLQEIVAIRHTHQPDQQGQ